jgi:lysozyme family protein
MDSAAFRRAIGFTLSDRIEGDFTDDPEDRGNWTGGAKGKGELKGTKYGISAAAYPHLDIASLRKDEAIDIYWRDYWIPVRGDDLPPRLAGLVFDAAVNHGVGDAARMLQRAVGATVDGVIGPRTLAASRQGEQDVAIANFLAERLIDYMKAPTWKTHGRGWSRRLFFAAQEYAR